MVDEMAKAASTGNTSVEQLGDAFLTVGGLAKNLNGGMVTLKDGTTSTVDGVQELEIALTAMANAGIKGSEAGTHMRNMLLKLSSPTEEGTKQLEALGVSVFDAEGNMRSLKDIMGDLNISLGDLTQEEKIQALSELFNTRDQASAEALLSAIGEDWDKIGEAILNAEGAAAEMAEIQLDNLAGDVTLFKSALEGAQIALSDNLTPTLREFVQLGTQGIQEIGNAIKEGDWSGAAETLGNVVGDGVSIMLEKLPLVVEAGGQLLSGLIQGFSENAGAIADGIAGTVVAIVDFFSSNIGTFIEGAINIATQVATGLIEHLPEIMVGIGEGIINGLVGLAEGIGSAVNEIFSSITDLFIDTTMRYAFIENVNGIIEESNELISSFEQTQEAKNKLIENADAEASYYTALADELKKITDENGKVKDGYEARADFIVTTLNEALGAEIEMNGNVIESYGEIEKSIDSLIEKQRAEAILAGEKAAYEEALTARKSATEELVQINDTLADSEEVLNQKIQSYRGTQVESAMYMSGMTKEAIDKELRAMAAKDLGLDELMNRQEELEGVVRESTKNIAQYENDWSLVAQERYDEVGKAIIDYGNTNKEYLEGAIKTKEDEVEANRIALEEIKDMVSKGEVPREYAQQAKDIYDKSKEELDELERLYQSNQDEIISDLNSMEPKVVSSINTIGASAKITTESKVRDVEGALKNVNSSSIGHNVMQGYINAIANGGAQAAQEAEKAAQRVEQAMMRAHRMSSPSKNAYKIGSFFMQGYENALFKVGQDAIETASQIAEDVEENMITDIPSVDFGINEGNISKVETPETVVLNEISARLDSLENNLYNIMVNAISNGVSLEWNDRELGRMVKTYA